MNEFPRETNPDASGAAAQETMSQGTGITEERSPTGSPLASETDAAGWGGLLAYAQRVFKDPMLLLCWIVFLICAMRGILFLVDFFA